MSVDSSVVVSDPVDTPVRRGGFKKGCPPGPGRPRGKGGRPPIPPRKEVEGEGLLRAMRFVLANHRVRDRDPREVAARSWLDKDPQKFLMKLEEEELREKRENVAEGDEGQERVERLIEKLMKVGVYDG